MEVWGESILMLAVGALFLVVSVLLPVIGSFEQIPFPHPMLPPFSGSSMYSLGFGKALGSEGSMAPKLRVCQFTAPLVKSIRGWKVQWRWQTSPAPMPILVTKPFCLQRGLWLSAASSNTCQLANLLVILQNCFSPSLEEPALS